MMLTTEPSLHLFYFYFTCMCGGVCHVWWCAFGDQKRLPDSLELKLQIVLIQPNSDSLLEH